MELDFLTTIGIQRHPCEMVWFRVRVGCREASTLTSSHSLLADMSCMISCVQDLNHACREKAEAAQAHQRQRDDWETQMANTSRENSTLQEANANLANQLTEARQSLSALQVFPLLKISASITVSL